MTRILTSQWFWLLTFVLGWLVVITVLIADGYGAAPAI
jgi:hypothetical protein